MDADNIFSKEVATGTAAGAPALEVEVLAMPVPSALLSGVGVQCYQKQLLEQNPQSQNLGFCHSSNVLSASKNKNKLLQNTPHVCRKTYF